MRNDKLFAALCLFACAVPVWSAPPATLSANDVIALRAQIAGQQATLSLNGQSLGPTPLTAPGSGRVGMLTAAFSQPGLSAAFTNFTMTPAP